ncbi:BZRAP1 [Acrasis kona]|uniref:BZRAP1 n=1 Tax=Acrasis kona TaxID=1008807 RepID=A0AAW2YI11_9EUKA
MTKKHKRATPKNSESPEDHTSENLQENNDVIIENENVHDDSHITKPSQNEEVSKLNESPESGPFSEEIVKDNDDLKKTSLELTAALELVEERNKELSTLTVEVESLRKQNDKCNENLSLQAENIVQLSKDRDYYQNMYNMATKEIANNARELEIKIQQMSDQVQEESNKQIIHMGEKYMKEKDKLVIQNKRLTQQVKDLTQELSETKQTCEKLQHTITHNESYKKQQEEQRLEQEQSRIQQELLEQVERFKILQKRHAYVHKSHIHNILRGLFYKKMNRPMVTNF